MVMSKVKKVVLFIINNLLKIVVGLFFLFPFYWMFTTSFKPYLETLQFPPTLWPQNFSIDSYISVFKSLDVMKYLSNTIIVTLSVVVIQILVIVPAAYAFAKWNFKGKKLLFMIVMISFMIPGQVTFISSYFLFSKMGILNTLLPQILPSCTSAFGIFMLRQVFMQIPEEILESARLDNTSELKIIWKIMIPMSKSSIITISLFNFIGVWNAYFWPLVMTKSDELKPITLALERLKGLDTGLDYSIIMAGNIIIVIPVLILFLIFSKKIIRAMAYRGMK